MDKLKELLKLCKCGVFLTVNEHRDYYQSAEQSIKEYEENHDEKIEVEDEIRQMMIKTDTIIRCQFYPHTPVGFHEIWHYDLNKCLQESLDCLK